MRDTEAQVFGVFFVGSFWIFFFVVVVVFWVFCFFPWEALFTCLEYNDNSKIPFGDSKTLVSTAGKLKL